MFTQAFVDWIREHPLGVTLAAFMILDVLGGLTVAFGAQAVSSSVSRIGVARKAMTLIVCAVAYLLDPHAQGIPLGNLTAFFFIITEAISVIENAAKIGLPIPRALKDVLAKLRGEGGTPPVRLQIEPAVQVVVEPGPEEAGN